MIIKVMGIDNGLEGCCVLYAFNTDSTGYILKFFDTPTISVAKKTGGAKRELDIWKMADILRENKPDFAMLEKAQAMPGQGVVSMFNTGKGFGVWLGLLTALAIPHALAHVKSWQKIFFEGMSGDTKQMAYTVCCRLFPIHASEFKTPRGRLLDGRCDALLLAEYGRRFQYVNKHTIQG